MNNSIVNDGLIANITALRHTLAAITVDATTAYADLEHGNLRAAIGALVPVGPALLDAKALLDAILVLNRRCE